MTAGSGWLIETLHFWNLPRDILTQRSVVLEGFSVLKKVCSIFIYFFAEIKMSSIFIYFLAVIKYLPRIFFFFTQDTFREGKWTKKTTLKLPVPLQDSLKASWRLHENRFHIFTPWKHVIHPCYTLQNMSYITAIPRKHVVHPRYTLKTCPTPLLHPAKHVLHNRYTLKICSSPPLHSENMFYFPVTPWKYVGVT